MKNMTKRQFKNERNLHKLFATNLPVVPIPADFAEQLVQSVLEEVAHHHQSRAVSGEHRVLPTPPPAPRRRVRTKRPPQALLLGMVCLWVSLLFLMSGCAAANPGEEHSHPSPMALTGAQPPLTPLLPRLPMAAARPYRPDVVSMPTAVQAAPPVTLTLITPAMLSTSGLVTTAAAISQTARLTISGGLMRQETAAPPAIAATATSPPAELTAPPPTSSPATATAPPTDVPTRTALPIATPSIPPLNPFLPTATAAPPTPTIHAPPSPTPALQPLRPTATPA